MAKNVLMHKTCLTSQILRLSLARFFHEGKYAIVCKFAYIFRTDENPFGSCQPCSNNTHITYDDNTAAHWATVPESGVLK